MAPQTSKRPQHTVRDKQSSLRLLAPQTSKREHDLESLCRELLNRAQQVKDEDGGRIAK